MNYKERTPNILGIKSLGLFFRLFAGILLLLNKKNLVKREFQGRFRENVSLNFPRVTGL